MNNKFYKYNKKISKRIASTDEIIYIFEKTLEGWKTIKIYNVLIQTNPNSKITKEIIEKISTGNSKIFENEINKERYEYYNILREKVYQYHNLKKPIK
jgi:hypothetical protein